VTHWAISIDEFTDECFDWLETHDEGPAGHYARYTADTKGKAVKKLLDSLRPLIEKMMYESDDYGTPKDGA